MRSRVIYLDEAKNCIERLEQKIFRQLRNEKSNSFEMQLLKSIHQKVDLMKENAFYGNNIEKRKIPAGYRVQNLWRVELAHFWRLLYTVRMEKDLGRVCFIVDIVDHGAYDRIFGYR